MWRGPFTRYYYPFGRGRTVGKVDTRDAAKFLTQRIANGAERVWRPYKMGNNGENAYFSSSVVDSAELAEVQAVAQVPE